MIQFVNVSKTYDTKTSDITAVEDINFTIEDGEFIFLIGPSGSGKTTLIRLLIREENPSEGVIYFDGDDITLYDRQEIYNLRRKIGVIFQDYKLIDDKTLYENIAFVMEAAGKHENEIKETVPYLLDIVGLADRQDAFPPELSGGEKQRIAIARALANNPKVLIADEPTGNLDPEAAWDIVQILKKINDWGTTVIMSTHGSEIVNKIGKRVIRIERGKVVRDDKTGLYSPEEKKSKENFEDKIVKDQKSEKDNNDKKDKKKTDKNSNQEKKEESDSESKKGEESQKEMLEKDIETEIKDEKQEQPQNESKEKTTNDQIAATSETSTEETSPEIKVDIKKDTPIEESVVTEKNEINEKEKEEKKEKLPKAEPKTDHDSSKNKKQPKFKISLVHKKND